MRTTDQCRDGVATVSGLRTSGVPEATIHARVRNGRWQRVLPGIVVLHSGPVTAPQWRRAALAYGGRGALLSHYTAAELHRFRIPPTDVVEITVPHGRSRRSTDLVVVHQSRARLDRVMRGGLPCTSTARTVVDVGCAMTSRDDVRALVSDTVQRGLSSLLTISREVERAPRHGRKFVRAALEEVAAGARSAGEARLLSLLRRAHLPLPAMNEPIRLGRQVYYADALWSAFRLVVEIDGATWHLNAVNWDNDLVRQNALQTAGFVVLRFPYTRLVRDPDGVILDIRRALTRLAA